MVRACIGLWLQAISKPDLLSMMAEGWLCHSWTLVLKPPWTTSQGTSQYLLIDTVIIMILIIKYIWKNFSEDGAIIKTVCSYSKITFVFLYLLESVFPKHWYRSCHLTSKPAVLIKSSNFLHYLYHLPNFLNEYLLQPYKISKFNLHYSI